MAPIITEPKKLSMPQQVEKNREEIKKVWEYLDGVSLDDKLVFINSTSGTFTAEQIEILKKPLAFISDGTTVYIKTDQDENERFVFASLVITRQTIGNAYIKLGVGAIHVNIATGAYELLADNIIDTYNKDQVDSIIANIMALLNGKASLSGANFSGDITAPSITEIMTGYSYVAGNLHQDMTALFVSTCKTGNKLTCVWFIKLIATQNTYSGASLGDINIPNEINANLVPFSLSGIDNLLDTKVVPLYYGYNNKISADLILQKYIGSVVPRIYVSGLTPGTTYLFRYEITFLLGDNLAS